MDGKHRVRTIRRKISEFAGDILQDESSSRPLDVRRAADPLAQTGAGRRLVCIPSLLAVTGAGQPGEAGWT